MSSYDDSARSSASEVHRSAPRDRRTDRSSAADRPDSLPERFRSVFVVGNSRSGTTMMSRILGRHPCVHAFNELHFFDELTSRSEREKPASAERRRDLLCRLLTIERDGYLHQREPARFRAEAEEALSEADREVRSPSDVYRRFLSYEVGRQGVGVACEQTPRNVFHLREIHRRFPAARVVNMVRDPRAVLLSQKNKWRRRFLGGDGVPLTEAARSWMNYHPVTVSQIWRTSVLAGDEVADEPWVKTVRFEDVLREPEKEVREVCAFAELDFGEGLLRVPQVGSSNAPDRPGERGIDVSRLGSWREDDGLSSTEVWICERIAAEVAVRYGYEPVDASPSVAGVARHALSLPFKAGGALLANLGRFSDLWGAVRRRLR